MKKSTMKRRQKHFTAMASLAAQGLWVQAQDVFGPVRDRVQIAQKTVKYPPTAKLYQTLVALLAGAQGLVEVNTLLRSDRGLQTAFGCQGCAEQSVIQETLDACTPANVMQLQDALGVIMRQHGRSYRHNYAQDWQILDADLTGCPCGRKAELATKGYFGAAHRRRGRQLLRVVASRYQEVLVDQLVAGNVNLSTQLPALLSAAEDVLQLTAAQRQRTIVRLDAGGGSVTDINWLLDRGYAVHAKDYAAARVRSLVDSVTTWVPDPCVAGREVGWVTAPADLYHRPVVRIAARCPKANGQWGYGVIVSTLSAATVRTLTVQPAVALSEESRTLLAYVYFYDQRGGGVETSFKEDKQGLGLTKRTKKRFAAQQMVMLLGTLAHNLIIWLRRWLAAKQPKLAAYGIRRWVRDVSHISGVLVYDAYKQICTIILNQAAPLAKVLAAALTRRLKPYGVTAILGET